MDEILHYQIDSYVRNEMTQDERLAFEQEALDDENLRREIALTLLIKKLLGDRKRKLMMIKGWEAKRRTRVIKAVSVASIAAVALLAIAVIRPDGAPELSHEVVAQQPQPAPTSDMEKQKKVSEAMTKVRQKSNDKEVVDMVDDLENEKDIHSVTEMQAAKFMNVKKTDEKMDEQLLQMKAYELYWLKICSLIRMGKKDEAIALLRDFTKIKGTYQEQADSLLIEMVNK